MNNTSNNVQRNWAYFSLEHIPWLSTIGFLLAIIGVVGIAILTEMYVIIGAVVVAVPLVVIVVRYPRIWLYLSVMLWVVWFRTSDEGVSFLDAALVAFYIGGLLVWFVQKWIRRQSIVSNEADWIILCVFGITVVSNIGIAWFYGSSLLLWAREFLLLCFILFYFPIREYFTSKVHTKGLLVIFALVVFVLGITNIQLYIKATSNALIAAELFHSRVSLNETVFVAATIYSIVAFLYTKRLWVKALLLLLAVYYSGVLLASMSRGPWLSCIVGIIMVFFFVDKKRKVKIVMLLATSMTIVSAVIILFFGHIGNLILSGIEMRFLSSAKGTQDISLKSRVMESQEALRLLSSYPLSGTGMGSQFSYYEPINSNTSRQSMIHNGYVFIAFKLGVPLAIPFFLFFFLYLLYGTKSIRYLAVDSLYRSITIAATSTLVATLILNIPANQFILRDGVFLLAFHIGFIEIAQNSLGKGEHACLTVGNGIE